MGTFFIISFLIYFVVLNIVLMMMIRPKFIFKEKVHVRSSTKSIALAVLFVTSFWLGSLTYTLKLFNDLVIF